MAVEGLFAPAAWPTFWWPRCAPWPPVPRAGTTSQGLRMKSRFGFPRRSWA